MAEADVKKCDWYGFLGFIAQRYCIWLSSCPSRQHQLSGPVYLAALSAKHNRRRCWAEGPLSHPSCDGTQRSSVWFKPAEMQRGPQTTKRNLGRSDTICGFTG